ncbi:DNRLRE domain-containing protein [Ruania rhizosphaerae]|uniref:DNRLRE domain-containing protein n=1 Tax=Ruania rhizosphaerae TaxID=1840413 RepID=UPI00135A9139|nr:DNRLRE domain-containing protein [Ruania rhizosphaerae]
MPRTPAIALVAALAVTGSLSPAGATTSSPGELIFHSGFEDGSTLNATQTDITGVDSSVAAPNDWVNDLEGHLQVGKFDMQYEGLGGLTSNYAAIVPAPDDPSNETLTFRLTEPLEDPAKGRIQANVYDTDLDEMYYRMNWYVPGNLSHLETLSPMRWLTVAEFWNDEGWKSSDTPYRMTVGLTQAPGGGLSFTLQGDVKIDNSWVEIWHTRNDAVTVPYDEWFAIDYYFLEGDAENGRFAMTLTTGIGTAAVTETVFAVQTTTHHPDDSSPDGLNGFNPMKMYGHSENFTEMADHGGMQWYYDDIELWSGTPSSFDPESLQWQHIEPEEPDLQVQNEYLIEFEDLSVASAQTGADSAYEVIQDPQLSEGAGVRFNATDLGDLIQFATPMVRGTYELEVGVLAGPDQGRSQLFTLGDDVGEPIDFYAEEPEHRVLTLGTVTAGSTGGKAVRLTSTERASASSGSAVTVDFLRLTAIPARIIDVSGPAWNHGTGDTVDIDVTFDRPVTVTSDSPTPSLDLGLSNDTAARASYSGGSGTTDLTFTYTAQHDDSAPDGLGLPESVNAAEGALLDEAGRSVDLTLPAAHLGDTLIAAPMVQTAPATGLAADVTTTADVIADTFVRTGGGADLNTNFGGAAVLQVRNDDEPASSTTSDSRRSYVTVGIGELRAPVTAASLELSVLYAQGATTAISPVDDVTWGERDITWNSQPVASSELLDGPHTGIQTGDRISFDVTTHVAALVEQGHDRASFVLHDPTGQDRYVGFASRDHADTSTHPAVNVTQQVQTQSPMVQILGTTQWWCSEPGTLRLFVATDPAFAVAEVRWAAGDLDVSEAATAGEALVRAPNGTYSVHVPGNGPYTAYVRDTAGNERVLAHVVTTLRPGAPEHLCRTSSSYSVVT